VLIVDDNEDAADMLSTYLEAVGHVTTVAHDGPTALHAATGFGPDAALVDIGLPVMDGYELANRLREQPGLERLTLIAVTGYGLPADRERSATAGFDAHLVKPVDLEELKRLLRSLRAPVG
jgi:CheY-like chemotaxis protein